VSSPAARAQARKGSAADRDEADGTPRKADPRKELAQAQRQVDEWRKKAQAAQEETKKLSRVLAKELGDGVGVGELVEARSPLRSP
jgi:hypothetical protein